MRYLLCNTEGSRVGYYDTSRRVGGLLWKVPHKRSSALQSVFVIAYWVRCDVDTSDTHDQSYYAPQRRTIVWYNLPMSEAWVSWLALAGHTSNPTAPPRCCAYTTAAPQ